MPTEEEIIAELMETEEGRRLLARWAQDEEADLLGGEEIGEIPPGIPDGMSQEAFDAMNNEGRLPVIEPMPPQDSAQIGASPVNPGATRGLPPGISGIDPEEENQRRREEMMRRLMGLRN
jgi:hypothetical protein